MTEVIVTILIFCLVGFHWVMHTWGNCQKM